MHTLRSLVPVIAFLVTSACVADELESETTLEVKKSKKPKEPKKDKGKCREFYFQYKDGHVDHVECWQGGKDVYKDDVTPPLHVNMLHVSCSDDFDDEGNAKKSDLAGHQVAVWWIDKDGDGTVDCGEQITPVCGDGTVDPGEACDDGNTANGDGCSSTCSAEPGKTPCCGDGHVDAGEQCDDGNTSTGDGCSSTCQLEHTDPTCPHAVHAHRGV